MWKQMEQQINEMNNKQIEQNKVMMEEMKQNIDDIKKEQIKDKEQQQKEQQELKQQMENKIEQNIYNYNYPKKDKNGQTQAMLQALQGVIPDQQYYHDPNIKDINGYTVAHLLAWKSIIPPKQWQHKPELQNQDGLTIAMLLASNGIVPPKEWVHDPNIKNTDNHTVAYYINNIFPVPNEWYDESMKNTPKHPEFVQQAIYGEIPKKPDDIDPQYDCGNEWTVAMLLAYNGKEIPEEWQYDKLLTDEYNQRIDLIYAFGGHNIPDKWKHDKLLKNKYGWTIAMYYALGGHIPPQEWQHDPKLQNNNGWTVAMLLSYRGIIPPKQWIHDKMLGNIDGKTVQYLLYQNNIEIPEEWKFGNQQGQTDAMIQAINGIIPNEQYYHNPNIKDFNNHTVCYYLWDNSIIVPEEWQDNQYKNPEKAQGERPDRTLAMQQVDDEKKIPDKKYYHDPRLGNKYNYTVAYYLKLKRLPIPNAWYDQSMQNIPKNPDFIEQAIYGQIPIKPDNIPSDYKNCDGFTVAMILAMNNKNIPKQWQHSKYLRNYYGQTVQMILQEKHIQVPEQWQYLSQYDYYGTPAIQQARKGIIPDKDNYHEPWISTQYGETVAYQLIRNGIEVPQEWLYNPSYRLYTGETTAMQLAKNKIIPPQEWQHDPDIKDNYNKTVKDYLQQNNIEVPNEWQIKTEQEKTNKQHKKTIIKNAKVEDVADMIPSRDILEQQGDDVAIYTNLSDAQLQRLQEKFGKENISSVECEYKDFIKAKNLQPKISFAKFCRNEELKDDSQILFIIRSDPCNSQEERAKQFVKDIVKICYDDNEQHTCIFFVRGQLFKPLIRMTTEGVEDKNGKITKQVRIYRSQKPYDENIQERKSIMCKVFVTKKDIPKYLEELQKFENKVTCTFSNPEKLAKKRKQRMQRRNQRKQEVKIENGSKQQLVIQTDSQQIAKKLQETLLDKGFQSRIDNNNLIIEQDIENAMEFAKLIKINGKKLEMKLQ